MYLPDVSLISLIGSQFRVLTLKWLYHHKVIMSKLDQFFSNPCTFIVYPCHE